MPYANWGVGGVTGEGMNGSHFHALHSEPGEKKTGGGGGEKENLLPKCVSAVTRSLSPRASCRGAALAAAVVTQTHEVTHQPSAKRKHPGTPAGAWVGRQGEALPVDRVVTAAPHSTAEHSTLCPVLSPFTSPPLH